MNECYALFVNRALTLGFVHVVCSSNIVKDSKHVLRNVNGHAVKKMCCYIRTFIVNLNQSMAIFANCQPSNQLIIWDGLI